jgi:hypothetical protein
LFFFSPFPFLVATNFCIAFSVGRGLSR